VITFDEDDAAVKAQTAQSNDRRKKLWQALVERAVETAVASGTPFTIEKMLNSVGILPWAPYRSQAFEYATTMLSTAKKTNAQDDESEEACK